MNAAKPLARRRFGRPKARQRCPPGPEHDGHRFITRGAEALECVDDSLLEDGSLG